MAQQIEGFSGNGPADVNSDHQFTVKAVTEGELEFQSDEKGNSFTWSSGTYNPAAADTILLVKNTDSEELHIEGVWLSTDADTRAVIHIPTTEVTPTGTAITGTNMNTGNSKVADATAIRDETNNTQGNVLWSGEIMAAGDPYYVDFQGAVILAEDISIGVDYVADAGIVDVTIIGHYGA